MDGVDQQRKKRIVLRATALKCFVVASVSTVATDMATLAGDLLLTRSAGWNLFG
jgi:hypothetical protein